MPQFPKGGITVFQLALLKITKLTCGWKLFSGCIGVIEVSVVRCHGWVTLMYSRLSTVMKVLDTSHGQSLHTLHLFTYCVRGFCYCGASTAQIIPRQATQCPLFNYIC